MQLKPQNLLLAGALALGCKPNSDPARPGSAADNPCADFALDAERIRSKEKRGEIKLGEKGANFEVEEQVVERIRTKMDNATRDFVMMNESNCKDRLRGMMPEEVYVKISACLDSALIKQRTAIESEMGIEQTYKTFDNIATHIDSCQNKAIYSYYDAPENTKNPEATRRSSEALATAEVLNDIGQEEEALEYATIANQEADKTDSPRLKVGAYVLNGYAFLDQFNVNEALEAANKALSLAIEKGYEVGQANAYVLLGKISIKKNNTRHALQWYKLSLEIRERILQPGHPDIAEAIQAIATVHFLDRNYAEAQIWYEKSLDMNDQNLEAAKGYLNLANAHALAGNYDEALKWYMEAQKSRELILGKNHPDMAAIYGNIGTVHFFNGNRVEAEKWYRKQLEAAGRSSDYVNFVERRVEIASGGLSKDNSRVKRYIYIIEEDNLTIPSDVESKFEEIITLIRGSKYMNEDKRQYWINQLPHMSEDQINQLRGTLLREMRKRAIQ